jgi:hypothetical protein
MAVHHLGPTPITEYTDPDGDFGGIRSFLIALDGPHNMVWIVKGES